MTEPAPGYPTPPASYGDPPARPSTPLGKVAGIAGLRPDAPKPYISTEIVGALDDIEGTGIVATVYVVSSEQPYVGSVNAIGEETVAMLCEQVNPQFPGDSRLFLRLDLIVSVQYDVKDD